MLEFYPLLIEVLIEFNQVASKFITENQQAQGKQVNKLYYTVTEIQEEDDFWD